MSDFNITINENVINAEISKRGVDVEIEKLVSGDSGTANGLQAVEIDPSNPTEGMLVLNTTENVVKVFYSGEWQVLHTLEATVVEDEDSILLEGGDNLLLESGFKLLI